MSERRIVTVTPNPAVDLTYRVDSLRPGESHRLHSVVARAGGKGLNVARVLAVLEVPVLAVAPLGGAEGAWVQADCAADHLPLRVVPIAGTTRRTVTVVEDGDRATLLNEPGPTLSEAEQAALLDAVSSVLDDGAALVVSGSLPGDAPPALVGEFVRAAAARGVPCIADVSGPTLLAAAQAGAAVVKPNEAELRSATGNEDLEAGARTLLAAGAGRVVVSRGPDGLLMFDGEAVWRTKGIPAVHGNPTGAGDAVVAGLAAALRRGAPWPDALSYANAVGAAAVRQPLAGSVDGADLDQFLQLSATTHR